MKTLIVGILVANLLLDLVVENKERLGDVALGVMAIAIVLITRLLWAGDRTLFENSVVVDGFGLYFKLLVGLAAFGAIWMSLGSREVRRTDQGEYWGILLASALGIPMTHVPYKGMQPAINDVAGGHLPLMFSPIPFALPLAQAGKLRMLGVTTAERLEAIPDVPPLAEIGVKNLDAVSWFMLVAPARTPQDVVDLLYKEVRTVTEDPEVRKEFVRLGLVPVASPPPAALKDFVRSEIVRWGEIVRKAGLQGTE